MTDAMIRDALRSMAASGGNQIAAAAALGISRGALQGRLRESKLRPLPTGDGPDADKLRDRVRELETELKFASKQTLDSEYVKRKIIGLTGAVGEAKAPEWVTRSAKAFTGPGVPTIFASDFHWGEIVDPGQIGGVNKFNVAIAHERLRTMIEVGVDLLRNHISGAGGDYPGIVFALGGDMVSGDIHEELMATNEAEIMKIVIDLWAALVWAITALADEFGRVFVPCVTGNHGRNTHKIRAKGRNYTSFDWLLYQFLAKRFENDKRVTFFIPDGPDALYSVMGHRYLLTHGDQFRGGDGMIGALGPIIRGDHRKRSRNGQIGMEYDTMLMGHWHQLIQLQRLIVNGCFPAGSLVSTPEGVKAIETLSAGDSVLSRDGSVQTVTHRFDRSSEQGLVHLKVRGLPAPLTATPNHLVWAIKGETKRCASVGSKWDALRGDGDLPQWICADFISAGDYVHVPRRQGVDEKIDAETAWAWGLYLAEGSTLLDGGSSGKHNRICLTMHERELEVLQRFASWFSKTYGIEPRVYHRRRRSGGVTSELVVSPGRGVCAAFRDMFGHGAGGKHLPSGALGLSAPLCRAIVQGWFDGDGHTTKDGVTSATTISQTLAHQMFMLALSAGLRPSMASLTAGGRRKSDSYTIHLNNGQESIEVNGELFYRVHARYRDREVVPVYDLEVSGEHTYTVVHVGVHNSLKGYDEYANQNNFGYEPPRQALWLTHPDHGITFSAPIHLERSTRKSPSAGWVAWKEAA